MNAPDLDTLTRVVRETITEVLAQPQCQYLDTRQAAAYLGLSRQRLESWRCRGGGPEFTKLGSAVRYARHDLDGFMRSRRVRSTSEEVSHG